MIRRVFRLVHLARSMSVPESATRNTSEPCVFEMHKCMEKEVYQVTSGIELAGLAGSKASPSFLPELDRWKVMPVCQLCWSYPSDVVFRWLLTLSGSGSGSGSEGHSRQPVIRSAGGRSQEGGYRSREGPTRTGNLGYNGHSQNRWRFPHIGCTCC